MDVGNIFSVKNKVVLVTGGSRGIGKMIATGFVQGGAKVYISARSRAECEATAKELSALGPGLCIPQPADLQKVADVEKLVSELRSKEEALHILVNNAGATWGEVIDSYPDHAWTKVMTLNVQRVFTLTQMLLPMLRTAALEGGHDDMTGWNSPARIINIGSVEGLEVPGHETFAYAASKAALHHLSRHLAGRLGNEGITSNTIACGAFATKMTKATFDTLGDALVHEIPLGRLGAAEDAAGVCLFLSSRAGAYVNGATISLDGGMTVNMNKMKL